MNTFADYLLESKIIPHALCLKIVQKQKVDALQLSNLRSRFIKAYLEYMKKLKMKKKTSDLGN